MSQRAKSPKPAPAHGGDGQLRIIAGQWRSRQFNFPMAAGLRPTPNRVRATLFNWLAPYVEGASVLDLFAGSGALFLEALSRGAGSALARAMCHHKVAAWQQVGGCGYNRGPVNTGVCHPFPRPAVPWSHTSAAAGLHVL